MRRHTNREDATRRIKGLATNLQSKWFPFLGLRYCWFIKGCSSVSSLTRTWSLAPQTTSELAYKIVGQHVPHHAENCSGNTGFDRKGMSFRIWSRRGSTLQCSTWPLQVRQGRGLFFVCCIYAHVGQIYQRISCMSSRSPAEPYSARQTGLIHFSGTTSLHNLVTWFWEWHSQMFLDSHPMRSFVLEVLFDPERVTVIGDGQQSMIPMNGWQMMRRWWMLSCRDGPNKL